MDEQVNKMSNWSELPHDLLVDIAARFKKLEHFVTFGSVCKEWCAVGKKEYFKGLWLRPRTPYLMLPVGDDDKDDARELYGLVEHQIMTSLRTPKFKGTKCHESLGWLLAVENDGSMCLLDPFSSVEIPVLHQRTFPGYEEFLMDEYVFVQKFVLSARPSETFNFIVMIICGSYRHLAFWTPEDYSWTRMESRESYCDVMYYGGRFYTIDNAGYVRLFNLEGNGVLRRKVTRLVLNAANNLHAKNINDIVWRGTLYILKTPHSLFVISRTGSSLSHEDNRFYSNTSTLKVYEVDMSTSTWKEIKNIGNMAIFVGHNATFAIDTSSDTSRLSGKIKANHIYFTDDGWEYYHFHNEKGGGNDMGVYNLETETIESFYSEEVLLSKVCPSIWITPSILAC